MMINQTIIFTAVSRDGFRHERASIAASVRGGRMTNLNRED